MVNSSILQISCIKITKIIHNFNAIIYSIYDLSKQTFNSFIFTFGVLFSYKTHDTIYVILCIQISIKIYLIEMNGILPHRNKIR